MVQKYFEKKKKKKKKKCEGIVANEMDIIPKLSDPVLDFLNLTNENYLLLLLEIKHLFITYFNFLENKNRFRCVLYSRISPW